MIPIRGQLPRLPLSLLRHVLLALCFAPVVGSAAAAQRSEAPTLPLDVRALGRLERADMAPVIAPFLSDRSPAVRAEAANALAQATWRLVRSRNDEGGDANVAVSMDALRSRLRVERDPVVISVIAQSLGLLPYRGATKLRTAERAIAALLAGQKSAVVATGAARGLESLVRIAGRDYAPSAATLSILRSVARGGAAHAGAASRGDTALTKPRRLAMLTLISARGADSTTVRLAMRDADPQLRRLAALAAGTLSDTVVGRGILRVLLMDPTPMVRTEAVRAWSHLPGADCAPLLRAAADTAPHVSVTAIDAIGSACSGTPTSEVGSTLAGLVRAGVAGQGATGSAPASARLPMHRAAHAIVALAHSFPTRATELLGATLTSPAWQLRAYTARAAAVLADTAALVTLARDDFPNVRTEAIAGLGQSAGHAADSIYIDALAASDYQLVLTAANALRDTPDPARATRALLAALARITAEKRETSRDPRMAILETLRELGSSGTAGALIPYLADFDPVLADSAAAILSRWSGRTYQAAPRRLPDVDAPPEDPERLRDVRVRFTMAESAGGGSFELRLFPDEAPATVSRFVRLVRAGYYDGLTVHRVVPNFVVQGGSPGANEYVGDGPFMRDEVGTRSHSRGTVGISTRGRDTGDAQFFINLVDNPRLDHEYTVFADVTAGMEVIDQLLEGDIMERVEIMAGR